MPACDLAIEAQRVKDIRVIEMPPNIFIVDPSFELNSELNNACLASVIDADNNSQSLTKANGNTHRESILVAQDNHKRLVGKGKTFNKSLSNYIRSKLIGV